LVTHLAMRMGTEKVSTQASSMSKTLDYDKANCLGLNTDYFYMTESDLQSEGLSLKVIRRICFDCPIQPACAEYGFKYEKYGTFGGYIDQERMLITGKQWGSRELRRMFEQLANLGVRLSTVFEYAAIKPTHIVPAYWKKEGFNE
jgi:hypothetical protein